MPGSSRLKRTQHCNDMINDRCFLHLSVVLFLWTIVLDMQDKMAHAFKNKAAQRESLSTVIFSGITMTD